MLEGKRKISFSSLVGIYIYIYIYSTRGVSRSASIVIAYLISKHKMTYEEAFHLVREKRPEIDPNAGFRKKLLEYEK